MAVTFNTTLNNAPVGTLFIWSGTAAPTGYLFCDGSFLSRTTYAKLFNILCTSKGTFTVTIATPGVFTLASHGLATGNCVSLTTTGALPTGLVANTNYYVIYVDANTFRLATSYANALVPTPINTTGSQSGTHSLLYNPYGISGASNFLLPDSRAAFLRGDGTSTLFTANKTIGLGHYNNDVLQGHRHYSVQTTNGSAPNSVSSVGAGNSVSGYATLGSVITSNEIYTSNSITDGVNGTPRTGTETAGKSLGVKFIIKY